AETLGGWGCVQREISQDSDMYVRERESVGVCVWGCVCACGCVGVCVCVCVGVCVRAPLHSTSLLLQEAWGPSSMNEGARKGWGWGGKLTRCGNPLRKDGQ